MTNDATTGHNYDVTEHAISVEQPVAYLVDSQAFAACQRLKSRGYDVINMSASGGFAVVPNDWLKPGPNYLIGK